MNNSTKLTYEGARAKAASLREKVKRMEEIFDNFTKSINGATSDGVYEGAASEALLNSFNELKPSFVDFCNMVTNLADDVESSTNAMEASENQIKNEASNL